ncbi:putative adenosine monophosphate-protein transferase Fic [Pseudomonas sp. BN515]|uniref:putative adenosine monophosphate-protein transferase Fic n=1 Tax=Pseudomonas sp. BN515 TaxID=2567892 RepID=UPI0024585C6E|nr:putative adenosine monophosphate-protein transferase Fic [Pseudomonas sp. BN515]MDH4872174.1 putative adenosine monophosphate-protein transferase Fic [Pseudomonas sp. BN515]
MRDKYGADQDPYCYPGSLVLRNLLDIRDEPTLDEAERALSEVAAGEIDFTPPPYDLNYLARIHLALFRDIYEWAGELRTVDIAKGGTYFCNVTRLEPEANKLFRALADANWLEGLDRPALIAAAAELYGDMNMLHPFRDGNGRAQRILFEHLIANAGFEIDWWVVERQEWIQANIDAVVCDYRGLIQIFERCVGQALPELDR